MSSQAPAPDELRQRSAQQFRDGNFRDAYDGYRQLCLNAENDPLQVGSDLGAAVQSLMNLGRTQELDDLLEKTVETHRKNWRLLEAAARQYQSIPHHGFLIAGKFERGDHRGGGKAMNAMERDRVRGLQLMAEALPLATESAEAADQGQFLLRFAELLLRGRGEVEAWRLQTLTDLTQLPDYEDGYGFYRSASGAPVDAEGNPVYHAVPADWPAAQTDGQRWRWLLARSAELHPPLKNEARFQFAQFLHEQFDVQTLQQIGIWPRGTESESGPEESGTYALHTLGENETIARLATGIKRFALPDEFNFIRLMQAIAAEPETGHGEDALNTLAQTFENRRQYPRALAYWKESVQRYGRPDWKSERIQQIESNWGQFEFSRPQPAKEGAQVEYRFRNGKSVAFEAHEIQIGKLLDDVKAYLKSAPRELDWQKIALENIGYRLVAQNETKYLGRRVAQWDLDLEPPPQHFDKRITVTTPLQKAGAYLLVAKMADGNTSRIIVWVADTAIVYKSLAEGNLYYLADAVNGQPLPGANIEFFGYRLQERRGRATIDTRNFAEKSDQQGLLKLGPQQLSPEYQWVAIARTPQGRLAFLGFQGIWVGQRHDPEYEATRAFCITDRPVYRPGQKTHFKIWFRHARYDIEDTSDLAGQTFKVRLVNPKGDEVLATEFKADEYGGIEGEYPIPPDATLGQYRIVTDFGTSTVFRVEEYKKPEFEVLVEAPQKPVMLGEEIQATIQARYYFGSPVVNATVKYTITRSEHSADWFPLMPWDWCYGRGYWWFAYNYEWYPGWNNWVGCMRPLGWWWPRMRQPPEVVAEQEVEIGPDGTVSVNIDTAVAKAVHGDQDQEYTITAEVRDQSRRTIVGRGAVLVARKPFKVYTWVDGGYYRVGDTIRAHFLAQTLDQRPVVGRGRVELLKIRYDEERHPVETAVAQWEIETNAEGQADLQMAASEKGQYRLSCKVTDSEGHEIEGGYVFTVIGEGFTGAEFRFNQLELIPDRREYQPGEKIRLQINTDHVDSTVLLFLRPTNGVYLPPEVVRLRGKSTVVEIPVSKKDMPNLYVEALTIAAGKVFEETKEIVVPPEKRILNIEVLPNQKEYKPGERAQVKLRLTDFSGEAFVGTLAATVYDKSLEYISGGSNVPDIRDFFWKWRRHHQPQHQSSLEVMSYNLTKPHEVAMRPIGIFGATVADEVTGLAMANSAVRKSTAGRRGAEMRFGAVPMSATRAAGGAVESAAMPAMALDAVAEGEGGGAPDAGRPPLIEPTIRTKFADTALWVGTLNSDDQGMAEISLDMPENLTTWKILTWGMGHGTKVGSGEAEVVTRKNLILRMQTPRFAVQTDEVVLSANVHNYLKTAKDVVVSLETPGDILEPLAETSSTVNVPADGEVRVDWRVRVVREGVVTVRMKALTDEESDGAELTFPCHVHGILKTEAWAGTIRPDGEQAAVTVNVPEQRRVEQSVLEVRYSPTLAGAMVDALPYLLDYPYGCTEQTLNRFLPAVITQKVLQEMNLNLAEIREKRTNLNAQEIGEDVERARQWKRYDREPVFDPDEMQRLVKEGVDLLTNMQNSDGGWGWFAGWNERSYPHTTCVVLRGLLIARQNDVAIVPGVIENGVGWLKRYQDEQVLRIRNADGKIDPWKPHADDLDALVYQVLAEADVADESMRGFLYRDRNELSVYAKALFGLAVFKQNQQDMLSMIMRNLGQYLVQDEENETAYLRLPNESYWWFWYGDEIEAQAAYLKLLARVDPQGQTAPRLVKYLLNNRKHATYWRSTRDTALCVEAFADYLRATGETKPEMSIEVWIDGEKRKEVEINTANLFYFDNKFKLTGADVPAGQHRVELRRRGRGPVYFNVYLTNFTLEDPITAAGLEVRIQRKYYKLLRADKQVDVAGQRGQPVGQRVEKYERQPLQSLAEVISGDLIEVELEIESKNDYEYLLFEDWKIAGCEPVEVRSGYAANGLGAYMELRDDRVTFFVRQLARGKHSLAYRLRAEIPGAFSGLPAQASAMYAPELRGNSDEMKLRIADQE